MRDIVFQRRRRRLESKNERPCNNRSTSRASVGVVIWKVGVHHGRTGVLEKCCSIEAVVHECGASGSSGVLAVRDKAACAVDECASLPWVVWRRGRDNDVGALSFEQVCSVD